MSLEVWVHPHAQHGYVMGVDTAEGLGHGDYSCAHVLDLNTGELVASWHGHIPPDALADEVLSLGLWYRDALCCVEANNHGLTTITQLRQLGYPNLFRRRMRTFVRNERGSMSGSPYDDRVIALALANQMRKYAYAPEFVQKVDDYWTVDWFARLADRSGAVGDDLRIGAPTVRGTPHLSK